jgi:hypothetical protein
MRRWVLGGDSRPQLSGRSSNISLDRNNQRMAWHSSTHRQCRSPSLQRLQQCFQPNSPKLRRTPCQILARALHQRASPRDISRGMVMKCDRRLNQPLQKSFLHPFRLAPHVFPNLMGVIELARIEEPNPALITVGVHCHRQHTTVWKVWDGHSRPSPLSLILRLGSRSCC